jgi:hypothetical protein
MDNMIQKREAAVRRTLRALGRFAGSLAFSGDDFHWYRRDIE